jgi:hypothetical protein
LGLEGPPLHDQDRDDCAGLGCALRPPVLCGAPYFLAELADTSEADEQAAIDARQIRAGGIRYTATRN